MYLFQKRNNRIGKNFFFVPVSGFTDDVIIHSIKTIVSGNANSMNKTFEIDCCALRVIS
jgi:hypothetical protein